MKKQLSVKIDEHLYKLAKSSNPNMSRYINNLVKNDMFTKNQDNVYDSITRRMLEDVEFQQDLIRALESAKRTRSVDSDIAPPEEWA